jgi:hypothetical protein
VFSLVVDQMVKGSEQLLRVLRGRSLSWSAILVRSSALWTERSVPFGRN